MKTLITISKDVGMKCQECRNIRTRCKFQSITLADGRTVSSTQQPQNIKMSTKKSLSSKPIAAAAVAEKEWWSPEERRPGGSKGLGRKDKVEEDRVVEVGVVEEGVVEVGVVGGGSGGRWEVGMVVHGGDGGKK